jgi:hypothetical protein
VSALTPCERPHERRDMCGARAALSAAARVSERRAGGSADASWAWSRGGCAWLCM